jgi:hypothetical protein
VVEMTRGIKAGVVAGLVYGICYVITVPALSTGLASLLGLGCCVQLRVSPLAALIIGPIYGVILGVIYAPTYGLLPLRRIGRIGESEIKGCVLGFVVWLIMLALGWPRATLFFSQIEGAAIFQTILTVWALILFVLMGGVLGNMWNRFKPRPTPPPSREVETAIPSAEARPLRSSEMRFCPNCGNELPEGSAFCINCGKPIAAPTVQPTKPSAEKVSDLWYLLPFFLTWLGGLIAWFSTKSRDPAKARKMLIFGVVWFVVILFLAIAGAVFR